MIVVHVAADTKVDSGKQFPSRTNQFKWVFSLRFFIRMKSRSENIDRCLVPMFALSKWCKDVLQIMRAHSIARSLPSEEAECPRLRSPEHDGTFQAIRPSGSYRDRRLQT